MPRISQNKIKNWLRFDLVAMVFLSLSVLANEIPPGMSQLSVKITGLQSQEGQVVIALFDSRKNFTKKATQSAALSIKAKSAEWTSELLPPGEYAIALYHDENGNGRMDKNFLGIPREDFGFSRNAKPSFGPPKWKKVAFRLNPGLNTQTIVIQRQ